MAPEYNTYILFMLNYPKQNVRHSIQTFAAGLKRNSTMLTGYAFSHKRLILVTMGTQLVALHNFTTLIISLFFFLYVHGDICNVYNEHFCTLMANITTTKLRNLLFYRQEIVQR